MNEMSAPLSGASLGHGSALLSVRGLSVRFDTPTGAVAAVRDVSFDLARGEVLCVVGESGSGKSVTARSIMQIVDKPGVIEAGRMIFTRKAGASVDLATLKPRGRDMRAIRGAEISMIFQEPMSSLSPVHTIGDQIGEVLRLHKGLTRRQARAQAIEALAKVRIADPAANVDRYPFEYSGGMRQRVMIAMAIACEPQLLIADEPTTALDVTTQADILDLLMRLRAELRIGILFITHDLGVVAEVGDRVMVMRHGGCVETGGALEVLTRPQHAYSQALIGAVKRLESRAPAKRGTAAGAGVLLSARGVSVHFGARKAWLRPAAKPLKAVDGIDLELIAGESFGIVGESGSGKTTLARALLRIVPPTAGSIRYAVDGGGPAEIVGLGRRGMHAYRRRVRYVFQDPFASLNPRMTVGQIIAEPLSGFSIRPPDGMARHVGAMLERVGLPSDARNRYPHAFSGGQRQRIGLARALAVDPELIIADEATSALDVSLRAQMLDLMIDLQNSLGLTYLFITHDMGVVRYFCDRVAVMRHGRIVESGPVDGVCGAPVDDYTRTLLASVPSVDPCRLSDRGRHRKAEIGPSIATSLVVAS